MPPVRMIGVITSASSPSSTLKRSNFERISSRRKVLGRLGKDEDLCKEYCNEQCLEA